MENQTNTIQESTEQQTQMTDSEMLAEIYENTRKTKNYMKWQLIITVALVVIPLLATLFVIPFALKSLSSAYSLDSLTGGMTGANNSNSMQDLIQQYTK
jgi:hypothetical protein